MTVTRSKATPFISTAAPLSDVGSMAQAAMDRALMHTATQMDFADTEFAVGHIRQGDQTACGYFQYELAKEVAAFLTAFDGSVRSVYLYDCDATTEDTIYNTRPQASLVHLIVRTDRKSSALDSLILAFDRALADSYGKRFSAPEVSFVLDAQVVDENEVKAQTGYGGLLSSIYLRPTLVWGS